MVGRKWPRTVVEGRPLRPSLGDAFKLRDDRGNQSQQHRQTWAGRCLACLRGAVWLRSLRGSVVWIRESEAGRIQLMPDLGSPGRDRILSSEKWEIIDKF